MAPLITEGLTIKGKPNYRGKNNFFDVFNGVRAEIQELLVKQHAEARRVYHSNAVGLDMATNLEQKQKSKNSRQWVKFVVEAFHYAQADYIQTLTHDQQKAQNDDIYSRM